MPELDIAQALGFLSFGLGIMCFFQKNDLSLKIIMLTMNLNMVVHFALLDAWTASIASGLSAIRTCLSIKYSSRLMAYMFIVVIAGLGIYASSNLQDLIPILAACVGTYALFCLSGISMRLAFLFGALCWLTNNILVGSIGGTLLEITLLSVNLSTIYRLYRDKRTEAST